MKTQSGLVLSAAIGLLGAAPVLANDAPGGASRLESLRQIDSARVLFLRPADAPAADAQRSRVTALTVTFQTQVDMPAPPPAGPAPSVAAPALPAEALRSGGTNLYGFTRDPRATATTPAGLRFADPSLLQAIRPDLAAQKFNTAK